MHERAAVRSVFIGRAALGTSRMMDDALRRAMCLALRLPAERPIIHDLFDESLRIVVSIGNDDGGQAVGIAAKLTDLKRRGAVPASPDDVGDGPLPAKMREL